MKRVPPPKDPHDPKHAGDNAIVVGSIRRLLDGTTWSPNTLDQIAGILRSAGYTIGDPR